LSIQSEADHAFGEARAEVDDEALSPFPGRSLRGFVDVVAIEVVVAQRYLGFRIFYEAGRLE